MGSGSYTCCSEVFFCLLVSNGHHQVTKPQHVSSELETNESKFAYSILFYATDRTACIRDYLQYCELSRGFKEELTSWRMGRKEASTDQPPIN